MSEVRTSVTWTPSEFARASRAVLHASWNTWAEYAACLALGLFFPAIQLWFIVADVGIPMPTSMVAFGLGGGIVLLLRSYLRPWLAARKALRDDAATYQPLERRLGPDGISISGPDQSSHLRWEAVRRVRRARRHLSRSHRDSLRLRHVPSRTRL